MKVSVDKDRKGRTWIVSVKDSLGFTRQINLDRVSLRILHKRIGDILADR